MKEPNADILEHTKSDKGKADTLQSNFCSVFTKEPQGPLPDIENKHMGKGRHFKTFPQATYKKINLSLCLFLQFYFKILKLCYFLVLKNLRYQV